jgi:H2-forming N5,N10-methylenetetrahydromethanopterin dehydrogenase-like enzyme
MRHTHDLAIRIGGLAFGGSCIAIQYALDGHDIRRIHFNRGPSFY